MGHPLRHLALVAATCLAPLAGAAQGYSSPPGYTFGGMFPGMFSSGNGYGYPGGFPAGQSPFLTMPAPQYPFANPQFPNSSAPQPPTAPLPVNPMAQPAPYWMQTPPSPQAPARFITDVPSRTAPQAAPPGYSLFAPQGFAPQTAPQAAPPRWAPLPGQPPVTITNPITGNAWAFPRNPGQNPAPANTGTPPKWPTP